MTNLEAFGAENSPMRETEFHRWLCDRFLNNKLPERVAEAAKQFCAENNLEINGNGEHIRYIWQNFHFFKPHCRSFEKIDPFSFHGKEMVVKGLVNAFGFAHIPYNGYFEIVGGNLWAKFSDILGGRCIARTDLADRGFIAAKDIIS